MSGTFWKPLWIFFKFNFSEFCNNFVPDFENLYYLLHLNISDSNKESSSENSKQDCSKNSFKNACLEIRNGTSKVRSNENIEGKINPNGDQAVLLGNRLKGNFVSNNVANSIPNLKGDFTLDGI